MSNETENQVDESAEETSLEGGSYEVIRKRLLQAAQTLSEKADELNTARKDSFGSTELTVIGNERVRTENNCVPRDIVNVDGKLLFAFNVYLGLKNETQIKDVFSLHKFDASEGGFDLGELPPETVPGLLNDETFVKEFAELYRFYKDAKLIQVRRTEGRLLSVFQVGGTLADIKGFRWAYSPNGEVKYIDNRGEQDHSFPASHDFEWTPTGREDQVSGRHPHVNIKDQVFVETVGGDLTVKIENNTEDGMGIYREDVEDPRQSLDDAEIHYAEVGGLILLKILPYQEKDWRYLVFNTRTKEVQRIDAIGLACKELPEDHGIIFPGGFYLQTGESKTFDTETEDLIFKRIVRSPNGEDVLFVFYHQLDGRYLLLPYNLIRKDVQTPIQCHGFCLFDDGRMLVFRSASDEPTRVHPMQIWQTPFVSDEFAAAAPQDSSYLAKVGNADLVRGISDTYSLVRQAKHGKPSRAHFEELIAAANRMSDAYYWLGNDEVGNFLAPLGDLKKNTELIIDEYEKVQSLQQQAQTAIAEATETQQDIFRELRPEDWDQVAPFLHAMTQLRTQRGHLITLREVRYIDVDALAKMEEEVVEQFERVSKGCVRFLLSGNALAPLIEQIDGLETKAQEVKKAGEVEPLQTELEGLSEGLNLLSEVVSGLEVDDPTQRTTILESISEVFSSLNRVRATLTVRRKSLLTAEGQSEFAAQFKLLSQSISSSIALADTPEKCDEQQSRLMVQLEELEGRFSEFDEFLGDLTTKREEIFEAFSTKRQQLLDERQRRAQNIAKAAERILQGVSRRLRGFKDDDELNAYFASDAMILKLRQLVEQLVEMGDTVKADDLTAQLKSSRQDALRNLRDKQDLFEDGDNIIKLGKHKFFVNTQNFDLTVLPRDEGMALHLTGTDFYEEITDEGFMQGREYWYQQLVSENDSVYRGEYLAASILWAAEEGTADFRLRDLTEKAHDDKGLLELVRQYSSGQYEEGYERGIHDSDATKILEKLITLRTSAGLLRFAPQVRAYALLYWVKGAERKDKESYSRRCQSLGRLRKAFHSSRSEARVAGELSEAIGNYLDSLNISYNASELQLSGKYLLEELIAERPRFICSQEAEAFKDAFYEHLEVENARREFEQDLKTFKDDVSEAWKLSHAWLEAMLETVPEDKQQVWAPQLDEAVLLLVTENEYERDISAALTHLKVEGLLGQHKRIQNQELELRLDEFIARLTHFREVSVPGFKAFRELRAELLVSERERLRLNEFQPRVLTSFVRNQLINDVYLPMIGDNLAKQLGSAGDKKRTDLMGMLLLISPPGYGKTTLMEYVASRLGMVFMKVNGPSLGHQVISLDPSEAPNATARQEVEKINMAFEMSNNVMLYLDDIQHTHPELLQKFISLCDGQRRIEGVWNGRTQTYDLRGKKFCIIMAGNPYTESGDKFQIPDMLANRADTYNLGDILDGREEVFALSYIENSLTSNPVLGPLAARSLDDVHGFIRMAKGEEVPQTYFKNSYSRVEVEEASAILKRLFTVQDILLKVNQQYIASASQDDRFRTEPQFKLQGSYRNMNKLAEKVVPAMNDAELQALITDHYLGEAQTLTTGAEANLLKFSELRGLLEGDDLARWQQLLKDFRRVQVAGGDDQDPATKVASILGALSEHLEGIREYLAQGVQLASEQDNEASWILPHLEQLSQALNTLAKPQLAVQLKTEPPKALESTLGSHVKALERSLLPVMENSARSQEELRNLSQPLSELIEVLKLNALSARTLAQPQLRSAQPPSQG